MSMIKLEKCAMGHTPAVNVNDPYYQTGHVVLWQYGVPILDQTTSGATAWYAEVRPESVHSMKSPVDGWRVPTPWHHRNFSMRAAQASVVLRPDDPVDGVTVVSDSVAPWFVLPPPAPAFHDYLVEESERQALLSLKQQRVNLGVMFAERQQTAKLLESTCEKIARGIREYKSKNPKGWKAVKRRQANFDPRRARKAVPSSWLELQYGWTPLLNDINGVCQALAEAEVSGQRYRMACFGRAVRHEEASENPYRSPVDFNLGYDVTRSEKHTAFVRLDFSLEFIGLQQFSQLGLTNPLEVLWERVPYSFVLDWLIPVGSWISSLDADLGWKFEVGSASRKLSVTWQGGQPRWLGPGLSPWTFTSISRTYLGKYDTMTRSVYYYRPWPDLPRPRNPFTPKRTANALALLATALERTIK